MEIDLLRALFAAPAATVCTTVTGMDRADLHNEHCRTILDVLARRARRQLDAGDGTHPVPPTVVQLDLQQSGALAVDAVRTVLLDTVTGNPAPVVCLPDLLAGLRHTRLRRACVTVGEALADAGRSGTIDALIRALTHLTALLELGRRAGIEVAR